MYSQNTYFHLWFYSLLLTFKNMFSRDNVIEEILTIFKDINDFILDSTSKRSLIISENLDFPVSELRVS